MLGVDYYPEHWPLERMDTDLSIMKNNGLELIRVGEFLWSKLEPKEDVYDFSLLDTLFSRCDALGLKIILGTPSATPPAWLTRKHPDMLQKDALGHERPFGSRRHYCLNSVTYRSYVRDIVQRLANRYGRATALYAWQIDNEFGCEDTTYCYCEKCDQAFQHYLERKYQTVSALNQSWGTVFWSQEYSSFCEIRTPRKTNARLNPTHVLDFYRFSTHSADTFAQDQIDVIRASSEAPITHNFMVGFTELDYVTLRKQYDFISYDNYQPTEQYDPLISEFNFDLMWSLKEKPFTVMEQQPGRVNWQQRNQYYPPEWLRATTKQAFAFGAENVVYFRYRPLYSGAEQYHSGLLDYTGNPEKSPRISVVKDLAAEDLKPRKKPAKTGLFFDYENAWMHQINTVTKDLNYVEKVFEVYVAMRNLGYDIQFFFRDSDLSQYERVLLPYAICIPEPIRRQLNAFPGKVFLTCASDLKNEKNHIHSDRSLGLNFPSLAFEIRDFGAVSKQPVRWIAPDGALQPLPELLEGSLWYEEIDLRTGRVLGQWAGPYPGPAIVSSEDRRLLYTGTCFPPETLRGILRYWLQD